MGFFTLLLLGAIFVGSNAQEQNYRQLLQEPATYRQLLQEPIRQFQEPIRRLASSQYDSMFENQNAPKSAYLQSQTNPQFQLQSQYSNQRSQQQASSQQLPKSVVEASTSTDKLRQSVNAQEQPLFAQEMLKNQELSKKAGVTTVCVQVHSNSGNPVVCGPEISPVPTQISNYKSPPQEETAPQDKPKPYNPVPVVQPQMMRVYQNYIPVQPVARQPIPLVCKPETGITQFSNSYRLATAVPMPTEYGLSLGLNGERAVLPDGSISQYQWGAAPQLSRSSADRNLMQASDLRRQPLDQSQLRAAEVPLLNVYGDSLAKSIDEIMRASENAGSSSSYMSTMPGYERSSSDLSAVKRLEESREKLRKLTLELEELKKTRAADEVARATEEQNQQAQQKSQQISEEKRVASQEPLRPPQIAEREIRQ